MGLSCPSINVSPYFAITTVNLHGMKFIFTHIDQHLLLFRVHISRVHQAVSEVWYVSNGVDIRSVSNTTRSLAARSDVVNDFFTFKQDNAPPRRARETVALLWADTRFHVGGPKIWGRWCPAPTQTDRLPMTSC